MSALPKLPSFGSHAYPGATVEVEHEGFRIVATLHHDETTGAPWDEHDGHGPVSEWTTRDKLPGERVLSEIRRLKRYYDFAEAMRIAKRDGWGQDIPYRTPGIARQVAVEQDFAALKAWCNDEWFWCGVSVNVYKSGIKLTDDYAHALWGIECNYPGSDNSYLTEVATDYIPEALDAARARIVEIVSELSGSD